MHGEKGRGKSLRINGSSNPIVECQQNSRQTYGCRRVKKRLEKVKQKKVNIKAIRRIMRKFDLRYRSGEENRMPITSRRFIDTRTIWIGGLTRYNQTSFGLRTSRIIQPVEGWSICVPQWRSA
ncbi:MAG: transposase [Clostridia bacterium]|nr:transposase [Clostridia bacterium]